MHGPGKERRQSGRGRPRRHSGISPPPRTAGRDHHGPRHQEEGGQGGCGAQARLQQGGPGKDPANRSKEVLLSLNMIVS
jgi:hypothetical protein